MPDLFKLPSHLIICLFVAGFTIVLNHALVGQINHWETAVFDSDVWNYNLENKAPASDWNQIGFDDEDWPQGQGSIGYGDGDDRTGIDRCQALFMRRYFVIPDTSILVAAILNADYDDGFVVYINGIEVARANIEGFPPSFDGSTPVDHEAVVYNGGIPESFFINKTLLRQVLKEGENVIAIQTNNHTGFSSSDLTSSYWLSFGIADDSFTFSDPPTWFNVESFETKLPLVVINTLNGAYIPDEPKIPAKIGIIYKGAGMLNSIIDQPNALSANIMIERRGESSLFFFPKNNFGFETKDSLWEDMDVSFLNFPEEEDWILHGPYSDKTLLRNVLAMKLAESAGQYASRTRLVELVIDGLYQGVYVIMEKIKQDENRLDIGKLKEEDIAGEELTGGYVFKVDKGDADWFSKYDLEGVPGVKLEFQYVSPKADQITIEQERYIQSYVDSFERALNSNDLSYGDKHYSEFVDLNSFAECFLLHELSKDVDAFRISQYFHKYKITRGGKIHAGPLWDFNLSFGNGDFCTSENSLGWMFEGPCNNTIPFWWNVMLEDEQFRNKVNCRWNELRSGFIAMDSLTDFLDQKTRLMESAINRNFDTWPILQSQIWPNPIVTGSYSAEISYMKEFLRSRIEWMDDNMFGACDPTALDEVKTKNLEAYPNPFVDEFNLVLPEQKSSATMKIYDAIGNLVIKKEITQAQKRVSIKTAETNFKPGLYIVTIESDKELLTAKMTKL